VDDFPKQIYSYLTKNNYTAIRLTVLSLNDKEVSVNNENTKRATGKNDSDRKSSVTKGATVLVVEDNVTNFVLIARLLGYMGIHCEWKTSGYEVVEYADKLPRLDLILMDIRLPYEDGYGALQKLRSSDSLKDTLVVAVTAEASTEQMRKAREANFDGFIAKPLDPDRFTDQIRRILSGEQVWDLT
jgi:two-component system cell cycle response regulator DivK